MEAKEIEQINKLLASENNINQSVRKMFLLQKTSDHLTETLIQIHPWFF